MDGIKLPQIAYDQALPSVEKFLANFAKVRLAGQKERWAREREWFRKFNGNDHGSRVCGSIVGARTAYLTGSKARLAYDLVASSADDVADYLVIPELPNHSLIQCRGRLPSMSEWQVAEGPQGLPFAIVMMDADATWTLVLSGEFPGMNPCFTQDPILDPEEE